MNIVRTDIDDVLIIEPKLFGDARGFFMESWSQRTFDAAVGYPVVFVQDNHSRSARGVLRGLHYQLPPHAQGKLVRVTSGAVFDVAVDVRRNSPTCGRWVGAELTAENNRQFWIPPGFAHGFMVLSERADFLYKTTDFHAPACEMAVRWDDPELAIGWPTLCVEPVLSAKDQVAPPWREARLFE
jgi:dTDP-4-dehydrorhamnose 3,5-epimerase